MRLSHGDFDVLQRTILELYELRDLATFRGAAPQILLKIIPADVCQLSYHGFDPGTRQPALLDCVASDPLCYRRLLQVAASRERVLVLFTNHPFRGYILRNGNPTALKISDFLTLRQFKQTAVYREGHSFLGIDRELATPVHTGSGPAVAALGLNRRGMDFVERDRLILNLLRPHFEQALRNAESFTKRRANVIKPIDAYNLTPRETEVAYWIAQGKTNPEIAIILQLSARTVEKHMERILQKIGVENRATAAVTIAAAKAS